MRDGVASGRAEQLERASCLVLVPGRRQQKQGEGKQPTTRRQPNDPVHYIPLAGVIRIQIKSRPLPSLRRSTTPGAGSGTKQAHHRADQCGAARLRLRRSTTSRECPRRMGRTDERRVWCGAVKEGGIIPNPRIAMRGCDSDVGIGPGDSAM
jgi:hypothetical protein